MNRSNKRKQRIYNRMHMGMLEYYRNTTPLGLAFLAESINQVLEEGGYIQQPKPQFVVVRKKDGEEVGIFETLEEANEMIEKAKRGKKAALMLKE